MHGNALGFLTTGVARQFGLKLDLLTLEGGKLRLQLIDAVAHHLKPALEMVGPRPARRATDRL